MQIAKRVLAVFLALLFVLPGLAVGLTASAETYKTGDVITFGSYPQSQVEDAGLIAALNAQGGTWQSYGYYRGTGQNASSYTDGAMTASDFMRYKDVSYDGGKYRAVTFDGYRPFWTGGSSGTGHAYQDDNGFAPDNVYWFRYDPLQWRVLDGMTGLVMCNTVIDAQPYQQYCLIDGNAGDGLPAYWGDAGKTFYANNYAKSTIRAWLNGTFIQTAFSSAEEAAILTTALVTDSVNAWDGVPGSEEYNAPSTEDRVFLLSFDEVTNGAYGFDTFKAYDPARILQGSRYAQCQGLWVYRQQASADSGVAYWLLRSPGVDSNDVCHVDIYGTVRQSCDAEFTYYGICPAMTLDLRETPSTDSFPNTKLNVPAGATVGYKTSVTVTVTASDMPDGFKVALYDGETCLAEGEESVSWRAERIKESKTLTARIVDSQGNVQSNADGKLEKQITITVKTGFFAKVKAFFLCLFGLLPTVELKP